MMDFDTKGCLLHMHPNTLCASCLMRVPPTILTACERATSSDRRRRSAPTKRPTAEAVAWRKRGKPCARPPR
jgi:hypothetical protein